MLGSDTDYVRNMLKQMEQKVAKKPEPMKVDIYQRCLAFSLHTKSEFCSILFPEFCINLNWYYYYHSFSVTFEANSSNASEVGQKAHSENASSGGGERESVVGQPKTVSLFVIFHLYLSCLFGPLKMVQQDRSHSACRNLQSKHHPKISLLSFATPCMDQSFSQ